MNLKEVVHNYLTDNDEGMKQIITWFLNEVMQEEADTQAGAGRYRRTSSRKAYRNGLRKRTLNTRHGELTLDKHNCAIHPSRQKSLTDIPELRKDWRMQYWNRIFRESPS